MLSCHESTRLLSEGQDRPLGLKERLHLRLHLLFCSGCRHFGRQMRVLRDLTRAYVRGGHPLDRED